MNAERNGNAGEIVLRPLGERVLIVEAPFLEPAEARPFMRRLLARLEARPIDGWIEAAAGFASVAVYYDPIRFADTRTWSGQPDRPQEERVLLRTAAAAGGRQAGRGGRPGEGAVAIVLEASNPGPILRAFADELAAVAEEAWIGEEEDGSGRLVRIPVRYGGADGPDLADVARYHGITEAEAVRLHSEAEYEVAMLGFAPGFAYLDGLAEALATPRLDEPRLSLPAGAVGIGGAQTGVYPLASPGGWRWIGTTPLAMFDPLREPPALLRAGDRVRFVPMADGEVAGHERDRA
ncbi:5-oxoprolinase subunit PxpB [Paenibacillus thermoaerophilus]|uniref:5-oxoprolinase subunit PxpB n=1 Tax=Paenibacillus thermoaerophilus TaxID=1215385 RepID=A0ABW2V725_9BACL|nr:5-oxoprolinase subunit PxpB [Paenibacillus thermoaerophilus]